MSQPSLEKGDRVQILSGTFAGLEGDVLEWDDFQIKVRLSILGREITTELEWDQLGREGVALSAPTLPTEPPPSEMSRLLQAILDDPWDDDVRAVYADWLEDQDDPHHEYLRVQIDLDRAIRGRQSFDALVERERELRQRLDPQWVGRVRRLTTEPPTVDLEELVPSLAGWGRICTRLHPRQGEVPELDVSKVGGLFLWPRDEPWPAITEFRYSDWYRDHLENVPPSRKEVPPEGATVPLAPVLQLRAHDIPQVEFPEGKDLLQLFWCPIWSEEDGPVPFLFWRNSREVTKPHTTPPTLSFSESGLVPNESRVHCEQLVEYPLRCGYPRDDAFPEHEVWMNELARALGRDLEEVEREYIECWSVARVCKVGGYPYGNQWGVPLESEDGDELDCLLTLSRREIDSKSLRWCAVEDRNLVGSDRGSFRTTDLPGEFRPFGRGEYFVLLDRRTEPWSVSSFYDYS